MQHHPAGVELRERVLVVTSQAKAIREQTAEVLELARVARERRAASRRAAEEELRRAQLASGRHPGLA
jgi:hypothetical protein